MLPRICKLLGLGAGFRGINGSIVWDKGSSVPADGTPGYEVEGVYFDTTNGVTYVNEGTILSCDFNERSALTSTQEALLGATAGTATASKALVLDSSGEVPLGTIQLQAGMTPGTGISTGTGTICSHRVTKVGDVIKTEILLDITGLNDGGTNGDVIGKDGGTANCHIGQITAAVNGTIVSGRITCFEAPAGGNADIDLWTSTASTGAQDAAVAGLAGAAQMINHGAWSAGEIAVLSAVPAANTYLYLANGTKTDANYSAGIVLIELFGV